MSLPAHLFRPADTLADVVARLDAVTLDRAWRAATRGDFDVVQAALAPARGRHLLQLVCERCGYAADASARICPRCMKRLIRGPEL